MNSLLHGVGKVGALVAGWACLALSMLIGFEIISRKFFSFSVQGADEIGGYVLALVGAAGFTFAALERAHTRIDIFIGRAPEKLQVVFNVLAIFTTCGFAGFMALRAWEALAESIEFGSRAFTPLRTPMWLPQSIWFVGLTVFALVTTVLAFHAVILMFRDPLRVNEEYGPLSLKEEISGETSESPERFGDDEMDRGNQ